jgi:hypothetical protein
VLLINHLSVTAVSVTAEHERETHITAQHITWQSTSSLHDDCTGVLLMNHASVTTVSVTAERSTQHSTALDSHHVACIRAMPSFINCLSITTASVIAGAKHNTNGRPQHSK